MDAATRKLWSELGWNQSSWITGGVVTEDLHWNELSEGQRRAAGFLGFAQESWDSQHRMDIDETEDVNIARWLVVAFFVLQCAALAVRAVQLLVEICHDLGAGGGA